MRFTRQSALALFVALLLSSSVTFAQRDLPASQHRRELIGKQFDARVIRVGDGDTFDVEIHGETRRQRIRLEGIDAPEVSEVFGRESTTFLRKLVVGRTVHITGRDMDRYGRLIARVIVDGQDASTTLVRAGLACHRFVRDPALARVESQARAAGLGFWSPTAHKPRCAARE